jgi:spermidine synthase
MGGLALGAYSVGKRVDRARNPLRLYAFLELGIGLWALLLLPILGFLPSLSARGEFLSGQSGGLHDLALFFLLSLPLLPSAVMMGGTLPALLSHVARTRQGREGIAMSTGLFYGMNTLGAVTGTIASGFTLIGKLGVSRTNLVVVLVNLLIFAVAFLLSLRYRPAEEKAQPVLKRERPRKREPVHAPITSGRRKLLLLLYAASGFTALAYEIVWTRILIHYVGTTIYAFTLMLSLFLLGISAGSLAERVLERGRRLSVFHFGATELLIGATGSLGLLGIALLPSLHIFLVRAAGHEWWEEAAIIIAASGSLMLIPAFLFGVAFPLVCGLLSGEKERAGGDVGAVYAANTVGSIAGSLSAAFLLIPFLGSGPSVHFLSSLNLAIAGISFLIAGGRKGLTFTAVSFMLAVLLPVLVPSSRHLSMFPEEVTLMREEGAEATVAVIRDQGVLEFDIKRMIVNGNALSGSDYSGRRYMRLLGHLPVLLCDDPGRVLVICLGTGMTLGACSRHDRVRELSCAEISPEVVKAAKQFTRENYAVLDGGRARVIIGDGRTVLLSSPGTFDVITLEPPPPRSKGVVNLYSKDFYELCKAKLSGNGVMAQWVPLHDQSMEDVKILIRTFTSVFAHTTAWLVERHDLCLVGTMEPSLPGPVDLETRIAGVREELAEIDIVSVWDLLSLFVADKEGLDRYCGAVPVITDDRPLIEHFLSLPWNRSIVSLPQAAGSGSSFLEEILLHRTSLVEHLGGGMPETLDQDYLLHRIAMERFLDGIISSDRGLDANGLDEIRRASRLMPQNGYYRHYLGASEDQRREIEEALVRGRGDARLALSRYGSLELENGNYERAAEIFAKYTSLFPDDPAGFLYEGVAREQRGEFHEARSAYGRAELLAEDGKEAVRRHLAVLDARERVSQDSSLESMGSLAAVLWESERYKEAADVYAGLVRRDPRDELPRYNLAACLDAEGDYLRALEEYEAAFLLRPDVEETRNNIDKLRILLAVTAERPRRVVRVDGTEVEVGYEDPSTRALLGSLYARNEEYGRATRELMRALAVRPDYEEARTMLRAIETMMKGEGTK